MFIWCTHVSWELLKRKFSSVIRNNFSSWTFLCSILFLYVDKYFHLFLSNTWRCVFHSTEIENNIIFSVDKKLSIRIPKKQFWNYIFLIAKLIIFWTLKNVLRVRKKYNLDCNIPCWRSCVNEIIVISWKILQRVRLSKARYKCICHF